VPRQQVDEFDLAAGDLLQRQPDAEAGVDVTGADAGDVGAGDAECVADLLVDLAVGLHPF